ncbi:TCP-1/cpn60 chaperonin family protein [Prunus dulcis]|uniref:TCP-1/cpn60 chaperonin family protein n=1 Tax=Prunus dulcis TaxID=3755 RepID=A0A5H2XXM3_PRUDU|nr:TCP-1/cpn60 chaperonin family protein [Prunus dulcis]
MGRVVFGLTISDLFKISTRHEPDTTRPIATPSSNRLLHSLEKRYQLESCSVGADLFYKLINDTDWISSRHLDMATFLIQKRQLSHPLQFLEPVKGTAKKRGSKKAAASNIIDLPPSKLNNIHHYVHGSYWVAIELDFVRHTATVYDSYVAFTKTLKLVTLLHPISDTLARVLYNMHFYEDSEVEEVKQKGLKMSRFTPFSVCSIANVPQQRDGTSCGIMTVKFIKHLSAGISLDQVDPLKIKYYRLKLAIEGLRGKHIYEEIPKLASTWRKAVKPHIHYERFFPLKYVVDAACTVVRVDQIIMAKLAGGPSKRDQPAGMDED